MILNIIADGVLRIANQREPLSNVGSPRILKKLELADIDALNRTKLE